MPKSIAAFGEDFAHREVVGALIERVAREVGIKVQVDWRNAWRGHGKVVSELKQYLRDLHAQGNLPDIIVVATDANCKGFNSRVHELRSQAPHVPTVLAIPDPHIERWLLLDGAAFKTVFGIGCQAPDRKCSRDRYKEKLIRAVLDAGVTPNIGGIEFAQAIIAAMDLQRAAGIDGSLQHFLDDLRNVLQG